MSTAPVFDTLSVKGAMFMELNERIIQARKQAGLTQEQLGEKLGVSR